MEFRLLRRHWEWLGRRDPLWAVLTDPEKRAGGWDPQEFFRTGDDEIRLVMKHAAKLGVAVPPRRALDFGCGVGRLTQALASRFERCDGVDISKSMLKEARRFNQHPDTCAYHLNPAPNLALFPDGTFSFVYSVLVLQHMEPRYSQPYIRELLRVLAPDGLLVFQLPSGVRAVAVPQATRDAGALEAGSQATAGVAAVPAEALRTAAGGPLPAEAFRARLTAERPAGRLIASETTRIDVTIENCSTHTWPALPDARGKYQVTLGNHWLNGVGDVVERDDARRPLPYDMAPASRVTVTLEVTAPRHNGDYSIELDLVQEGVSWFAQRGSPTCRLDCRVGGGLDGRAAVASYEALAGADGRPFRERHPGAYRLLRATRLRDLYWTWRRALDGVKARRDRMLGAVKPPLVNAWRRRWRRGLFSPYMEMYWIPRDEVIAFVTASGGRVLDAEDSPDPHFENYRYWVVKEENRGVPGGAVGSGQ